MYCDRCGVEVGKLDSWEILVQIRSWEEESPLDHDKRLQFCKKCVKNLVDNVKRIS